MSLFNPKICYICFQIVHFFQKINENVQELIDGPSTCHMAQRNYIYSGCGGYGVKCHFQQYFSFIMADSFIGAGNQSTFFFVPGEN